MSDLRTAAQQALEALEAMQSYAAAERKGLRICDEAIPALRAALAQQAEPLNLRDPAVQKRLATQWGYVPAAQAEPVEQLAELQAMLRAEVDRLIAAGIQPQRKLVPLTEEEIYHATGHCGVSKYTAINIARVIEEASWKKNHGQA